MVGTEDQPFLDSPNPVNSTHSDVGGFKGSPFQHLQEGLHYATRDKSITTWRGRGEEGGEGGGGRGRERREGKGGGGGGGRGRERRKRKERKGRRGRKGGQLEHTGQ